MQNIAIPEIEKTLEARLVEPQDRIALRQALIELEEQAFTHGLRPDPHYSSLLKVIPETELNDPKNKLLVLEGEDGLEGFLMLEPWGPENDTYYLSIICVKTQGQGYADILLSKVEETAREEEKTYLLTYVTDESALKAKLCKRYEQVELREKDNWGTAEHQVTLRLKI